MVPNIHIPAGGDLLGCQFKTVVEDLGATSEEPSSDELGLVGAENGERGLGLQVVGQDLFLDSARDRRGFGRVEPRRRNRCFGICFETEF